MTDQQPIPRCTATNREGGRCQKRPILGGTVCWTHGGATRQVRAKAARRLAEAEAAREVARQLDAWGGRVDVSPPEALLELVQAKAAEVAYWNRRVADLDEDDRAGMLVSKSEQGMGPMGAVDVVTRTAAPHLFVTLLHKAQDQLAAYSAAAIRAGLDEAMVRLATVQAAAVIEMARRAMELARREPEASLDDLLLSVIEDPAVSR